MLTEDSFFTINSMDRRLSSTSGNRAVLARKECFVKYLRACYVDLDVGRPSGAPEQRQGVEEAAIRLKKLVEQGALCPPSLSARSGRGLYLLWLLHDTGHPLKATPERLAQYKCIQRAIVKQLSSLAADPQAIDAARMLRVPETIHSVSGACAVYKVRIPSGGQKPLKYTLEELTQHFDARIENTRQSWNPSRGAWDNGREVMNPGSTPLRARGPRQRECYRTQDLLKVEGHYDGWKKGSRLKNLRLLARFMKGAGESLSNADSEVRKMASRCKPAYPSDSNDTPLHLIARKVYGEPLRPVSASTLASWLGVTAEMVTLLDLRAIKPSSTGQKSHGATHSSRASKLVHRRRAVEEFISRNGIQSSRSISRALNIDGITACAWTINRDLKALGYEVRMSEQRRPGRKPDSRNI